MVQKEKRAPGRPRAYDADQVLDQALRVFWAKGYEATTVDDLTGAMGLSRPSLYNAYGDKEALFMRCLERYGLTRGALAAQALDSGATIQEAIHAYLRQAVMNATGEDLPHGCLIACVVPAIDNAGTRAYSASTLLQADDAIAKRLETAVAAGELPPDFPTVRRARRITDLSSALSIRARAGAFRAELLEDAAEGAALALTCSSASQLGSP